MDLGGVLMAAVDAGVGGAELGMLGSRMLKHGRGNADAGDHGGWGVPAAKQARTDAEVSEAVRAAAPYLVGTCSPGHGREKMLSFSSSAASSCHSAAAAAAEAAAMPLYYGTPASCSGLSSVSLSASIQGAMARVRGPFTPSQWMELEHQALIYKYMAANIPVPHNLLIPIRRSLTSLYPPAYFGSSTLGWGSFQLGYTGNADLEPGRCRRTDGKKWRCSRDAVSDQKYCERHMNRGKHRSRKHVEGQPGHAAKAMPVTVAAAAQPGALATGGSGATAGIAISHQPQQPVKSYASNTIDPCSLQYNREPVNKQNENELAQDSDSLSMLTSMSARNTGSLFPFSKEHNPFDVTNTRPDYGLVSSDSLMSSPHSSLENASLLASQGLNEQQSSLSLQHFVDWPRTPSQGALSWPETEDMQAQRTQLSVSAPMASSDLSSASTSPIHEKLTLSPLKLSREYSPIGLSITAIKDEFNEGEADWMPMFRDSSMGGPLGEALTKNSNMEARSYLSSSLSLMTDAWDSSPLETSPVGVLQKNTFGSVSSSTGSSPRLEHHGVYDGMTNLRDDLGSIVVNHPSIRLL
ncbi:growth-regulating factor 6 [Lolium perenne]|uniref:growth-regulating factor 6 n=1 Tax=Lolium perenne TaxID=4522 RepID=UPI0021F5C6F5|nr:growth-regulating factor 6-like [Lolium perenne]